MRDERIPVILLPGAVMPAAIAYADLVKIFGPEVDAHPKELELYAADEPPVGWGLHTEVEGIRRVAAEAGFERFHLVGYSGGGASSLAFCAAYPERLLSLALSEPAWAGNKGLSVKERERWEEFERVGRLSPQEMMPAFIHAQLREGVEGPPPPQGDPPPWMRKRPAGISAFTEAFKTGDLDIDRLRTFGAPVLFTLGGRSHPDYFAEIAKRLAGVFPDFMLEVFEDRHHFDPPHRVEPERYARSLRALWDRASTVTQGVAGSH
jgi:pimeloyl-ACP methyl ester carboxylesterase